MAKKYKNNELRGAYFGSVFNTVKEKTFGAIFLGIIAAGLSFLLNSLKNEDTSDDQEIFRE